MEALYKRYIDCEVLCRKDGTVEPLAIYWNNEDGMPLRYEIDRVLSASQNSESSRLGGIGKKYIVLVHGQRRTLFYEKNRWFIESHQP